MKRLFIVLDGIDGSGKGEVINRLQGHYSKNYKVIVTAEPTDGKYGKEIRELLKKDDPLSEKEKLVELYVKDREEHVNNMVAQFSDGILLCDRYYYSTIVYQSTQGIPINELVEMNKKFVKPDICFILDLDAELALKRIGSRGEAKEKFEKLEFMKKIRKGFLELKQHIDDNIKIIDASKSKDEVFNEIKEEIDKLI